LYLLHFPLTTLVSLRWHNAGIIVFAVIASHFVTLFGGGWGWLVIILAFTATYYQTSIKRTTRNVRDDMTREVAKKGLKADVESATWLNLFSECIASYECELG